MEGSALSLEGKAAIVTGAAGGIGSATARLLAARGARVMLADLDAAGAETAAHAIGRDTIAQAVDLADPASIEAMVARAADHFGRLDIIDNNAAFLGPDVAARDRDVETMDLALWDQTFAVNVRGTMVACRAALPHLSASGAGAIVNVVSNLALQGHVIQAAYAASKAAIIQMTRSIAASHGRRGVRCNAVAPGMTMTPALRAAFPPDIRKLVEDETLRDRLGEPEDIAEAVAFLASHAARNITGQLLVSDGGLASHVPGIAGFMALGRE
jgi:NAD(P)-dependent dehydrogenase (short-subunit alcohol dehydrogenase family)